MTPKRKFDRIVFVGGMIPDQLRDEVLPLVRNNLVASGEVLQRSLVKGLTQYGAPMAVLSSMHVGTYPRSYGRPHIRGGDYSLDGGTKLVNTSFWNLPLVGIWSRARGLTRAFGANVQDDAQKTLVVVYSLTDFNSAFLTKLAKDEVRERLLICLVVTDLPQNMVMYAPSGERLRRLYHAARRRLTARVLRNALAVSDCLVAMTPQIPFSLGMQGRPHYVMRGMVDTAKYDAVRVQHVPDHSGARRVTYTGGLEVELGVGDLLEAFDGIEDEGAVLVLCGDGSLRPLVEERARRNGRIRFLGRLTHDATLLEQLRADVLVSPSPSQGSISENSFPAKLLEYLYSGNPVVSRRLPGIPNEILPLLHLTEGDSVAALRQTIEQALREPEQQRRSRSDEALAYIRGSMSIESQVAGLIRMVTEVENAR